MTFFVLLWSNLQPQVFKSLYNTIIQLIYFVHQPLDSLLKRTHKELLLLANGLLELEDEVGLIKSQLVPLALAGGTTKKRQPINLTSKDAVSKVAQYFNIKIEPQGNKPPGDNKNG